MQIDGEDEYEVEGIKGHRERNGEMQYLTLFVGYDASEDMWALVGTFRTPVVFSLEDILSQSLQVS